MLHRLEIENFYSICELQTIDLIATKASVDDQNRLPLIGPGLKERAPAIVAFFGPNASGKSTVLKAIAFLAWFVRDSFSYAPDKFLPFNRFAENEKMEAPTRLAAWFTGPTNPTQIGSSDDQSCRYEYEVIFGGPKNTPPIVLSEVLRYWPLKTNRPVNLFLRNEAGEVKANKSFGLAGFTTALEKVLRKNASVISTLTQLNHPIATIFWQTASGIYSNIFIMRAEATDESIANIYYSDPGILKALNQQIERIDFGINKVELKIGPLGPAAWIHHDGLVLPLPMMLESHGTRQFIKIFPLIFDALARGGIAVIDELDLAIHPHILPEILRWFHDPKVNLLSAQLWITAQNPSLLEDLIKEEIYFCEKDSKGRTEIYGLKDIQAVRRNDNFYRKYLSGIYGAVPTLG